MSGEASGEPALSDHVLDEIRGVGGDRLVGEMLEIFSRRTPERLDAARAALAAGDLEAAARALHSLRSGAATVGGRRLAAAAAGLERAARRADAEELASGFGPLEKLAGEALVVARRLAAG